MSSITTIIAPSSLLRQGLLVLALTVVPLCKDVSKAQSPADSSASALAGLRLQFDRDLTKATIPELQQYIADLTALEKRAAAARNYAVALAVAKDRKEIEAELDRLSKRQALLSSGATTASGNAIELKADKAQLNGVTYDSAALAITGWSKAGAGVTWTLPNLPAGGYEVILHYTCGPTQGGRITVKEAFYTLTRDIAPPAKGSDETSLGTLRILSGSGSLSIVATSVLGDNLMSLRSVELVPSSR